MYNERNLAQIGAVLDTSVMVSGFRSQRGASAEILRLWRKRMGFQLIFSDSTLIELTETLLEENISESVVSDFWRLFIGRL